MPLFSSVLLLLFGFVYTNDRPIIGILTEEVYHKIDPDYISLIAASYVKAVEQSGARVAPIFINRTEEYYIDILNSLNGVLFPGGGLYFATVGGYGDAGRIILKYTKQVNSAGDHFPIFGVCLGFELIFYLEIESYDILSYCNATNVPLPLIFKKKFHHSRLYQGVPKDVIEILRNQPVTFNNHRRCVTEDLLRKYNLNREWNVLSTSIENNGTKFISSVESSHYPIAGIQFHAEKNAYEWNSSENIPHSQKAIYSACYFYDWLVREARKNKHSFKSSEEESAALIYNYNPTYVGKGKSDFEQVYFFK